MKVSGTGHRPNKLGGYSDTVNDHLRSVAIKSLEILQPADVMSGMAMGWDMALAEAALDLGIPLHAAVPFEGQERLWQPETQKRYFALLDRCVMVTEVCDPGYAAWKMLKRNDYMNDWADTVLALFDNVSVTGGTYHCIRSALQKKKHVQNAWGIFIGDSEELAPITL